MRQALLVRGGGVHAWILSRASVSIKRGNANEAGALLATDLVVSALSPNDLAVEVDAKREEYRRAGVRLIWIVNPETRTIHIYRADGLPSLLHEDDELSGEDAIPGFSCRFSAAFRKPAAE